MTWAVRLALASLALYVAAVAALVLAGRRTDARALAGLVPDCIVLFHRLLRSGSTPRRHKILLLLTIGYLAMPIDLVPDFIPVAGQADDLILVALALRIVLRASDQAGLLREYWPGPEPTLRLLERLVRARDADDPPR